MNNSRVHQCKSGHFHLFQEGVTPVWPFWSAKEAKRQIDFFLEKNFISSEEAEFFRKEIARLQSVQLRNKGKFSGRALPAKLRVEVMPENWINFFNGTESDVDVIDYAPKFNGRPMSVLGPACAPILCDFIKRDGDRAIPLRSLES